MIVVYLLLGATLLTALAGIGRRSLGTARSIDHYHKAMEALGEISEHTHRRSARWKIHRA
jgi:hypothetical protein